jgi:hypothetical protein
LHAPSIQIGFLLLRAATNLGFRERCQRSGIGSAVIITDVPCRAPEAMACSNLKTGFAWLAARPID